MRAPRVGSHLITAGIPLDLASLKHLRSVTIELVVLTSPYLRRMAQRITNLLLCALQPPALRKLSLSFNILLKSPDLLRYMIEGDVLDGRMEQSPSLQEVKFIFSIPSDFAQMPNLHRDIEQLIHGLLPKASARGTLQLRVLKPYTAIGSFFTTYACDGRLISSKDPRMRASKDIIH